MKTKALLPGTLKSLCKHQGHGRSSQASELPWTVLYCSEGRNEGASWNMRYALGESGGELSFLGAQKRMLSKGTSWERKRPQSEALWEGLAPSISLIRTTGSPRKLVAPVISKRLSEQWLPGPVKQLNTTHSLSLRSLQHSNDYSTHVTTNIRYKTISGYLSKSSTYLGLAHKYSCP